MTPTAQLGSLADNGAQYAQIGVSTAGSVATTVLPALTHAAWAVPVVGGAIAAAALALTFIFARKGPKQKEEASKIADQAEEQLKANLAAYLASGHTRSEQQKALANFDYAWAQLVEMWSQPALGEPGQRAINDRKAGACEWRDSGGQCWNWFTGYRDPIAHDPLVKEDTEAFFDHFAGDGKSTPILLWAGLAAVALGVML